MDHERPGRFAPGRRRLRGIRRSADGPVPGGSRGFTRLGVRARLVGIALVPLAGLTFFAWEAASPKWRAVERSTEMRDGADRLGSLTQARYMVSGERILSLGIATAADLGLDDRQAVDLFGRDLREELIVARDSVDEAIDSIRTVAPLDASIEDLETIRLRFDATLPTADGVVARYAGVEAALQSAIEEEAFDLDHLVADAALSDDMHDVSSSLPVVADALDAGFDQVVVLGLSLLNDDGDRGAQDLALAADTDRYERASALLDARLSGRFEDGTRAAWRSHVRSASAATFDLAVEAALAQASGEPAPRGAPDVTATFEAAFERSEMLIAVMVAATDDMRTGAEAAQVSARAEAARMRYLLIVVAGATLVVVLAGARSIARSLRRLDQQAKQVSLGALDTPLVEERGPREVVAVARALNDLVVGLRVAERQAKALAEGDLTDPSLREVMPGGLGAALHSAVGHLSAAIFKREELQRRLAHEASHDALTGLANRSSALDTLERAVARARRSGGKVAVLFADLDGFKAVNDTHGHGVGDAVLVEVARRMRESVRDGDEVARFGGDEIVVVAEPVQDEYEAVALAERLISAVSAPMHVAGAITSVGLSVGVAVNDGAGCSAERLMRSADSAVYAAKVAGRGRAVLADGTPPAVSVRDSA